ncbi:MAG: LURP-one-related family protein [Candidatus Heimdallarchaeota archaeon]|nr:LURP-one-related family protein [Candidatus Heimdallarchaeota archaeon]
MTQHNQPFGFKVQQKILAFTATYNIFDMATDQQVFRAKRKMFTIGKTIIIEDMQGKEVVKLKANLILKNKWKIVQNGREVGMVKFPLIRFCGIKFSVELAGNEYHASDLMAYAFTARDLNNQIGFTLDRRILTIRDTYRIDVYPPLDPIFGLAATLAVDYKFFQNRN